MLTCDNAAHWSFLAEGRHHAVFNYNGSDPLLIGKVLRAEKIIPETRHGKFTSNEEILYCRNVIEPWLSPKYTVGMQAVAITQDFMCGLEKSVVGLERRKEKIDTSQRVVYILNDLREVCRPIPLHMSRSTEACSYAIELKVKNGLKSRSPFYSDTSSLKYMYSKYEYMQFVKLWDCRDGSKLPWGGNIHNISAYNPHMLCSRHQASVANALHSLLLSPQNNLKISHNGQHIYGLKREDISALETVCSDTGFTNKQCTSQTVGDYYTNISDYATCGDMIATKYPNVTGLIALLSNILCVESVLERLELVMALDLLDVEGMACIFARACSLVSAERGCSCCCLHPKNEQEDKHFASRPAGSSVVDSVSILSLACEACQEGVLDWVEQCILKPLPVSGYSELARSRVMAEATPAGCIAAYSSNSSSPEPPQRADHCSTSPVSIAHDSAGCLQYPSIPGCGTTASPSAVAATPVDECLYALQRFKELSITEYTSPEDRMKRRQSAVDFVQQEFSLECCIHLLCVWLTALAASDASVVVTLTEVQQSVPAHIPCDRLGEKSIDMQSSLVSVLTDREMCNLSSLLNEVDIFGDRGIEVIRQQSEDQLGVIAVKTMGAGNGDDDDSTDDMDGSNVTFYAYEVSVIDVGPKSLNKIKEKIKTELETCSNAVKGYELSLKY